MLHVGPADEVDHVHLETVGEGGQRGALLLASGLRVRPGAVGGVVLVTHLPVAAVRPRAPRVEGHARLQVLGCKQDKRQEW